MDIDWLRFMPECCTDQGLAQIGREREVIDGRGQVLRPAGPWPRPDPLNPPTEYVRVIMEIVETFRRAKHGRSHRRAGGQAGEPGS